MSGGASSADDDPKKTTYEQRVVLLHDALQMLFIPSVLVSLITSYVNLVETNLFLSANLKIKQVVCSQDYFAVLTDTSIEVFSFALLHLKPGTESVKTQKTKIGSITLGQKDYRVGLCGIFGQRLIWWDYEVYDYRERCVHLEKDKIRICDACPDLFGEWEGVRSESFNGWRCVQTWGELETPVDFDTNGQSDTEDTDENENQYQDEIQVQDKNNEQDEEEIYFTLKHPTYDNEIVIKDKFQNMKMVGNFLYGLLDISCQLWRLDLKKFTWPQKSPRPISLVKYGQKFDLPLPRNFPSATAEWHLQGIIDDRFVPVTVNVNVNADSEKGALFFYDLYTEKHYETNIRNCYAVISNGHTHFLQTKSKLYILNL